MTVCGLPKKRPRRDSSRTRRSPPPVPAPADVGGMAPTRPGVAFGQNIASHGTGSARLSTRFDCEHVNGPTLSNAFDSGSQGVERPATARAHAVPVRHSGHGATLPPPPDRRSRSRRASRRVRQGGRRRDHHRPTCGVGGSARTSAAGDALTTNEKSAQLSSRGLRGRDRPEKFREGLAPVVVTTESAQPSRGHSVDDHPSGQPPLWTRVREVPITWSTGDGARKSPAHGRVAEREQIRLNKTQWGESDRPDRDKHTIG